jgi:hypothetical protein
MTLPAAIRSKVRLWDRLAPRMQRHVTAPIPGLPTPASFPAGLPGEREHRRSAVALLPASGPGTALLDRRSEGQAAEPYTNSQRK